MTSRHASRHASAVEDAEDAGARPEEAPAEAAPRSALQRLLDAAFGWLVTQSRDFNRKV